MLKKLLLSALFITSLTVVKAQFVKMTNDPLVLEEATSYQGAWGDFNNDGYPDIYVLNTGNVANSLYQNNGDGTFTQITTGAIATDVIEHHDAGWLDFNNDGYLDLFVAGGNSANTLYKNNGDGTFTKVTGDPLVTLVPGGNSAAWGDYDNDGDLDLVTSINGNFFENNGDGTFTKINANTLSLPNSKELKWVDVNNDGYPDLYSVDGDFGATLYINNGDKTFTKDTQSILVTGVTKALSQSWGDYNNDGYPDLFIGNTVGNLLFRNNGDGTFTKVTNSNLTFSSGEYVTDADWADYDNDGFLDIFMSTSTGADRLFHNNGDGTFTEVQGGFLTNNNNQAESVNWSDYDKDGFIDLFSAVSDFDPSTSTTDDRNYLFHNEGSANQWINFTLRGTPDNDFGTNVPMIAYRFNNRQYGLLSANSKGTDDKSWNIGIGTDFGIDSLVVFWPTGIRQVVRNLLPDQFVEVREDSTYLLPDRPDSLTCTGTTDQHIELNWKVATPKDLTKFYLFKSDDSLTFTLTDTLSADTRSFTDNIGEEGTRRYYKLLALNAHNFSTDSIVSGITKLHPPTGLDSIATDTSSIEIHWVDNSAKEDKYVIEASTDAQFTNPIIRETVANADSIVFDQLEDGTRYFFRVKAQNSETSSDYTSAVTGTTKIIAPTALSVDSINFNQMIVYWNDNTTREDKYVVEVATDSLFTQPAVSETSSNLDSLIIDNLQDGTQYFVRVKAANSVAESDYSPFTSGITKMLAPSNFQITEVGAPDITVHWTDNSSNEDSFVVEVSLDTLFTDVKIWKAPANVDSLVIDSLDEVTRYYLRLKAENSLITSGYTDVDSCITNLLAPSDVQMVSMTAESVEVKWQDNSQKEDNYEIEIAQDSLFTNANIIEKSANADSLSIDTLKEGTLYFVRIKVMNSQGQYRYTPTYGFATYLFSPSNLHEVSSDESSIEVKWNDNTTLEDKYVVEVALDSLFSNPTVIDLAADADSSVIDNLNSNTTYFIRVKAENTLTASMFSDTISAKTTVATAATDINATEAMTAFPNPVSQKLHLISGISGKANFKLYTLSGKIILEKVLNLEQGEETTVDVQGLPTGTYIMTVQSGNEHYSQKVIKK